MIPNQDRCDLDSHHSLTHLQISIPRALDAVVEASPDTEQPPEEVRSGARARVCVSERESERLLRPKREKSHKNKNSDPTPRPLLSSQFPINIRNSESPRVR